MKSFRLQAAVAAAFCSALTAHAAVTERPSTLADQQSVAVTIYNENLALIKDVRKIALDSGPNRLALREVSAQMRPETALLRSLSHAGALRLIEQNFDFDLLTPAKLLEKYVGRDVRIVRVHPQTGAESIETATVLAANQGVVLKIGDRIETGLPGRIVYDGVPANLRDKPTLVSELASTRAGSQTVELSYLSGGLAWKADYVAELNAKDDALDLNGWVTLTNRSGTSYPEARLQLVAGDVNRVRDELVMAAKVGRMRADEARAPASMAQETLFEYHLYTLQRPTTIQNNQTKQVALLSGTSVPVQKELVLQGNDYYYRSSVGHLGQKMKVGVFVQFENREASRLGLPMPKGVVRVYKKDSAGNAQFVGEDRIDHTPKNETVRLKLGEAFDVTADKKQTDFKRRDTYSPWSYVHESAYEIVLKNAKSEAVTVVVREPVPGDWKMLEETQRHKKAAAGTAEWNIRVPAEGSTTLRYRVLVRY
ncbi:MAG TPA: DUF4139 domain-containing protein [Burkholderiales bacterium]|nr:DUF4139 domain-containing protein [Burkholderiales bacterium]